MSDSDSTLSAKRQSISKKLRFEVFKRDSFTCQYCGRKAPDVILEVDHIHPVSKGGKNDLLNYITSCVDCNQGKSDRMLSDDAVLEKQRRQLAELQERREQIDMMFKWQESLLGMGQQIGERLASFWSECCPGWSLNEGCQRKLREFERRFGLDEVMEAMQTATDRYLLYGVDGKVTKESVMAAWEKIGGILVTRKRERDNPDLPLHDLYRLRARCRGKYNYWGEQYGWRLILDAIQAGATTEQLGYIIDDESSWTYWRQHMEDLIASASSAGGDE